jgi:hypothetical protein
MWRFWRIEHVTRDGLDNQLAVQTVDLAKAGWKNDVFGKTEQNSLFTYVCVLGVCNTTPLNFSQGSEDIDLHDLI